MSVVNLVKNSEGIFKCPECGDALEYNSGGAVRVVNGRVDYENTKPRHICYQCNRFYRELLVGTGVYDVFDLEEELRKPVAKKKRKIIRTGDLPPMQLKRDAGGGCVCPRCEDYMKYVEGGAVEIVNGRADMSNTVSRFVCEGCDSVFRRIATTDYFQWCEK